MPEADVMKINKPRAEVYAISGLVVLGGLGLVLLASRAGAPGLGPTAPLEPDEAMADLQSPILDQPGILQVRRGLPVAATMPTIRYQGPGRDTFSHFRIVQLRGGDWVTVYASGVAGVHVGPAAELTTYPLVSPEEVQPAGCPQQSLCAFPWPGTEDHPICGAPADPGMATAVLEIYERKTAKDGDGFASPSCNLRVPLEPRNVYMNKVQFI